MSDSAAKHSLDLEDRFVIGEASLKRVLRRAGVKRVSNDVYPALRIQAASFLERILADAAVSMENDRRNTIQIKDVEMAAECMGLEVA